MEFKVYPEKLHNAATQMRELDGKYEACSKIVAEAKGILRQYSLDTSCESLEKINDRIETQKIKNSIYYNTLDNIARSYEKCEKGIKGESNTSAHLSSETENVESLSGWNIITAGGIGIIGGIVKKIIDNNKDQQKEPESVSTDNIVEVAAEWRESHITPESKEEILDRMRKTRDRIDKEISRRVPIYKDGSKGKIPNDYEGYCGDLAVDQLRVQGLLPKDINEYKKYIDYCDGKTLAYDIAHNPQCHAENVEYTYYSTFDEMLQNNKEPITNIVCSWEGAENSAFKDTKHGHAMLITKIENGMVYFMDNTKNTVNGNPPQRQNGTNTPQCWTLDQFKQIYVYGKKGNNKFAGATVCKKDIVSEIVSCIDAQVKKMI